MSILLVIGYLIGGFFATGLIVALLAFVGHRKKYSHLYKKFSKPKKFDANMVVIGGGSAGLVTSYIAAAVKAKVVLIERHKMGGDCLNTGCVPSKAFIRCARAAHQAKHSDQFGVYIPDYQVNFPAVMAYVNNAIRSIEPHDSIERYSKLGVECVTGEAKIISPYEVQVNDSIITTKNIVIAAGASPFVPSIPGLTDIDYLTSDNLWQLDERPKRLLVLGGGPIGCELAQAFNRLGSEVTIVEQMERLLFRSEKEASSCLEAQFKKEGIQVKLGHSIQAFEKEGDLTVARANHNGEQISLAFDRVLVAVGRAANLSSLGIEELGIETKNGRLHTDDFLRTKYPNIFACGDIVGPYQFTHTASHQAWYACVNALFGRFKLFRVDYSSIPSVVYTDPEVAQVGPGSEELTAKGIEFDTTTYDISDLDRAIVEGEGKGFVRVFTAKGKDRILGVTIVGAHAGEMIPEFSATIKNKKGLNSILSTIHSYPTWNEANKYAAGEWKRANAPEKLLSWVERYHSFIRR